MDALTKTQARLARGLAIAAPVILTLLAVPLTLSAAFAAKVGLGSASATAIILAAFLSLHAHGDHSSRGELREFVSKAFTFAGAAPGFTLLVLGLAPVTVPIIEPLELGVPQPAEPPASPPSTVLWQMQVDTRIDAKIAAAFGQLRTAQAFPTETIVPLAVGCAVAVVIFVFTCWLADRAAKSKHVPPPAPPVTVEQMRAAIHRERRARRIESGAVWMLAVCIIATARRVRGR